MRHRMALRRFGRSSAHRRSMFRNMATSLFMYGKLETTVEKAKDLRRIVEKLITLAGEDTLARRRRAYGYLKSKAVVHKLFAEIGPRYKARPGGYTRIVRTARRPGDAAEMGHMELVGEEKEAVSDQAKAPKKAKRAKSGEAKQSKKAAA
jgi:large subunit ribosomal protein L17